MSDEREELLRRKAELEERIRFLESETEDDGLAEVQRQGRLIVEERERQLAAQEAAERDGEGAS
jgi:hypothetical protein